MTRVKDLPSVWAAPSPDLGTWVEGSWRREPVFASVEAPFSSIHETVAPSI